MTILLHIMKAPFYIYETANTARRAENLFGYRAYRAEFEQTRVSEPNFEQNKRFLRALPAGKISHFTSRIYPSLPFPSCHRYGMAFVGHWPYRGCELCWRWQYRMGSMGLRLGSCAQGTPIKIEVKILRARWTMGRGKRRESSSSITFPIVPHAHLIFFRSKIL